MTAIQHLLQRWGFVKLRRYGLELTSDGRILSTRPAVLDDGTGGRIVGWQDGDVSIWKLSRWSGGPGVGSPVASGVIVPPAAPSPAPPRPVTPTIPTISEAQAAPAAPSRASARVIPAEVAGQPPVDEDDWEWTIALARARVAVEEAEAARPPAVACRPAPPAPPAPRAPERPTLRSSATADLAASGNWRKTAETTAEATGETTVESAAYEDYRVSSRPAIAIPRTTTPSTVIPVPSLPTVDATRRARLEPVVRAAATTLVSRFAKGTGRVDPPTLARTRRAAVILDEAHPNLSIGDSTTPGVAPATRRTTAAPASELDDGLGEPVAPPAPSSGDRTSPGIALPTAARTVALPSIKRRTAR
jgi:hypothetical protein